MLPGCPGALSKVWCDGKKTETPDRLRARSKNIWADLLLPETSNMVRRKKCSTVEGGPYRF